MRGTDGEWGLVVEGPDGHVVVVASSGGKVGCCYAGQVVHGVASTEALPSVDLVTLGRLDVGRSKTCASDDEAQQYLAAECQRLARKMVFANELANRPIT